MQPGGRAHLRQHGTWDAEFAQQVVVPLQGVDVEEHGTGRIAVVRTVDPATGKAVDQKRVDRPEQELPAFGSGSGPGDVVEEPAELGRREVGIDHQPGLLPDRLLPSRALELIAVVSSTAILPDDRVVDRLAGDTIPDDRRLALIGDADGSDPARSEPDAFHHLLRHQELVRPDLLGIMLYPAGARIVLAKLPAALQPGSPLPPEEDRPGRSRTLVKGENQGLGHRSPVMERSVSGICRRTNPDSTRDGQPRYGHTKD